MLSSSNSPKNTSPNFLFNQKSQPNKSSYESKHSAMSDNGHDIGSYETTGLLFPYGRSKINRADPLPAIPQHKTEDNGSFKKSSLIEEELSIAQKLNINEGSNEAVTFPNKTCMARSSVASSDGIKILKLKPRENDLETIFPIKKDDIGNQNGSNLVDPWTSWSRVTRLRSLLKNQNLNGLLFICGTDQLSLKLFLYSC
jgi:hypothetical protein